MSGSSRYRLQTMNSEELKTPHLGLRFLLLLALAAVLTVTTLKVVSAPFWSLYFVGFVSAPFILYAIRKHDAERSSANGGRGVAARDSKSTES